MIKGIDVSKHQGSINWNSVKSAGITFAIIRGGYSTTIDPMLVTNYNGATSAGIQIGIYWFCYALNTSEAIKEADYCISVLKGKKISLPVFYDFEDDTEKNAKKNDVTYTKYSRTQIMKTFCDRIASAGYTAGLYMNENYLVNLTNYTELKKYPLWLAKWHNYTGVHCSGYTISDAKVSTQWGKPVIWQFSDKGKISGISGDVDLDYGYFEQT